MLLTFTFLVIELLIRFCYSLLFQICKVFFSMFVCGIHPPSLCHYRIFAMFDIFCSGLLMSTFHWFTLLGLSTAKLTHFITQNTSSQAPAPDKNIPAAIYTKAFLQWPLHPLHNLFLPTARKTQKWSPFFSRKIGNSTFHWFTSSGPLCSKTYSLQKPKHVIPSTCTRQEYSSSLLHQSLFAAATTSHT